MRALVVQGSFGERRLSGGEAAVIGTDPDCDIRVEHPEVSDRHARIYSRGERWFVADLGAPNRTALDGTLVTDPIEIRGQGILRLGAYVLTLTFDGATTTAAADEPIVHLASKPKLDSKPKLHVTFAPEPLARTFSIGRAADNDIVVDDPDVLPYHVLALRRPDGTVVMDTLDPDARIVISKEELSEAILRIGETFVLGSTPVAIPPPSDDPPPTPLGGPLLVATGASVSVKPRRKPVKQILAPIDVTIREGEFVAIIGGIGAGKSTLLRALGGVITPTQGNVTLGGIPIDQQPRLVGFVPQTDVVHGHLMAREALSFAARLRMPPDTSTARVRDATQDMLARFAIEAHANTPVRNLSGGQRKSVAVATELFGDPPVLLLDEPGASLDPHHERALMLQLRRLASGERAVVLVTHITRHLDQCNRILVMGPGGHLLKEGSPNEIREHFNEPDLDLIYGQLEEMAVPEERGSHRLRIPRSRLPQAPPHARRRDYAVAVRRSIALLARERTATLLPIGIALVFGALIGLQFRDKAFTGGPQGAGDSGQLIFILAIISTLLALFSTSTPLFLERAVTLRDIGRGMSPRAFMRGRLVVLASLCAVQAAAVTIGALIAVSSDRTGNEHFVLIAFICLGAAVASPMGAWIAWLATTDRLAAILSVMAIVPQLIFAGVLIKSSFVQHFISTKWVVAAVGSYMDLDDGPERTRQFKLFYGEGYFDTKLVLAILVLVASGALFAWLSAWQLQRVAERKAA